MTQGKIERSHRSMKNVVKRANHCTPWELKRAVARCVEHSNHRRYHETLANMTPADVYFGRRATIFHAASASGEIRSRNESKTICGRHSREKQPEVSLGTRAKGFRLP